MLMLFIVFPSLGWLVVCLTQPLKGRGPAGRSRACEGSPRGLEAQAAAVDRASQATPAQHPESHERTSRTATASDGHRVTCRTRRVVQRLLAGCSPER